MFSRFFIDRPIFASVLSIFITLAGVIAGWWLPVAQYPEIAPPTVEVSAVYPGANARIVADTVAAPIEQLVNGVEGMLYMSSQCTNDGNYTLTITFAVGVDLNMAQVMVQNRESNCTQCEVSYAQVASKSSHRKLLIRHAEMRSGAWDIHPELRQAPPLAFYWG